MIRLFWLSRLLLARPAAAARRAPPAPTTPAEVAPDEGADNDAPANERGPALPLCTLSEAQRDAYRARACALADGDFGKLPPYVDARSTRTLQHVAAAWAVRDRIVGVEVDGVALTEAELDDALPLVTWAREVLASRALPDAAPTTDAPPEGVVAMAAITADVGLVVEGLALRFGRHRRTRATLSAIRTERRPAMLGHAVGQLLVLCDEPATAAHLAKLPKGEAAAVARLRAALPAWERRVATAQVGDAAAEPAMAPQELARRAWALAQQTMTRVLRAGRYLAKGDAAQEPLWRAYRPAKKAKAPAAPTPTPDA